MKCPNCGFEMQDDQLYCEHCGTEIQIVPDFEPEIENSISETLNTLAEELTEENKTGERTEEDDGEADRVIGEDAHIFEKLLSNRKVFVLCTAGVSVAIIVLVLLGFFLYQYNSKGYRISRAIELADRGQYEKAVACLKEAESMDNTDANIYFLMADYYYQLGKEEDALLTLKNVALTPGFPEEDVENAYGKIVSIYRAREDYQSISDLMLACNNQDIIYMYQNYMAYPPDFSYIEGTYQEIIPLKLSSNTSGSIYYTVDGSEPDENSTVYTTPIFLETGTYEIKAFFVNDYGIRSEIVSKTYVIELTVPNAPEINLYSGDYKEPENIEIEVPTGCRVYYTTDGSEPTSDSEVYTAPISMPIGNSTFKFISYSKEGVAGEIVTRTYNLKLENAQYTVTSALETLSYVLLEQGYILDLYGRKEGIQGRYINKFGSVNRITDGQDYYFIYEYYEDLAENQSRTGRIFGVNIVTGECGDIGLGSEGYYFIPFETFETFSEN